MSFPRARLLTPLLAAAAALDAPLASAQQQTGLLVPSGAEAFEQHAHSACLAPNLAVLGSPFANRPQIGGSLPETGSVTLFEPVGANWEQIVELFHPGAVSGDRFGASVAVDGDTLVVGAPGVAGGGPFNPTPDEGRILIYRRLTNGDWIYQDVLPSLDQQAGAEFGASVAIEGDRIVVGAPGTDSKGAAYLFEQFGGSWFLSAKLAEPTTAGAQFGCDVAIEGGRILVGSPDESAVFSTSVGAAYLYTLTSGSWTSQKLLPPVLLSGQRFGQSVDLDGDLAIVGTPGAFNTSGAADIFTPNLFGLWANSHRLDPIEGSPLMSFGWDVAIDGNRALVGLLPLASLEPKRNGALFTLEGSTWHQSCTLLADDDGDNPGFCVDLLGDLALIGDPTGNTAGPAESGGARLFDIEPAQVTGCTALNPPGSLTVEGGTPSIGESWTLGVQNPLGTQTPGSIAYLAISVSPPIAPDCGTIASGWGMAGGGANGELVVAPSPASLLGPTIYNGVDPALVILSLPFQPSLYGLQLILQGVLLGAAGSTAPLAITEARRVCVGVEAF